MPLAISHSRLRKPFSLLTSQRIQLSGYEEPTLTSTVFSPGSHIICCSGIQRGVSYGGLVSEILKNTDSASVCKVSPSTLKRNLYRPEGISLPNISKGLVNDPDLTSFPVASSFITKSTVLATGWPSMSYTGTFNFIESPPMQTFSGIEGSTDKPAPNAKRKSGADWVSPLEDVAETDKV